MNSSTIVDRIWNYCHVLRDDGVSYGDYLEQLTYLLFLKMDYENVTELGKPSVIPAPYRWGTLRRLEGTALDGHYRRPLRALGRTAINPYAIHQHGGQKWNTATWAAPA